MMDEREILSRRWVAEKEDQKKNGEKMKEDRG